MIAISGTTQSLEVVLNGAAATSELPVTAAFVDIDQALLALVGASAFQGITNGATPLVLSAAPGAGRERRLNALTVVNIDTAPAVVTLQIDVSSVKRQAFRFTLAVGDQLVVTNSGIDILDSSGNKKQTLMWPTLTNHGVVVGQGAAPLAATAAGAANSVLHGNGAAADPSFSAVVEADLSLSDVTTDDVSSNRHGFTPKSPDDATKFLNGAAAPAYAAVKDSDLSTSDIATNNVSSAKHGFTPKSPSDATKFLNGAAAPAFAAVKDSDLSTSDIATNDVSNAKHGFTPKSPGDATKFLNGAAAPAFAAVKDSDLSTSDITTNDVSTSKHGFVPKAPNNTGQFLRADAAFGYPKERTSSISSSSTPTPNADTDDRYEVSALAAGATFGAPTGTPRNGQKLMIIIKDNGTARSLAWNAAYVAGGVALPTTTVISKILTVGFEYSTMNSLNKWRCIATAAEA